MGTTTEAPENSGNCYWDRLKVLELINTLTKTYTINLDEFVISNASRGESNYFEALVSVILSQNTSDKNAIKAFNNLRAALGSITPDKILELDANVLSKLIKVAGLSNRKAKALKELALVVHRNNNLLDRLKEFDVEEARRRLLELPGVGFKTADVFLLMILRKPTFPIDTHIGRIVRRLGIASEDDAYEDIRVKILGYLDGNVDLLKTMHLLLIVHGRRVCRARNPKCDSCPIASLCCKRRNPLY